MSTLDRRNFMGVSAGAAAGALLLGASIAQQPARSPVSRLPVEVAYEQQKA